MNFVLMKYWNIVVSFPSKFSFWDCAYLQRVTTFWKFLFSILTTEYAQKLPAAIWKQKVKFVKKYLFNSLRWFCCLWLPFVLSLAVLTLVNKVRSSFNFYRFFFVKCQLSKINMQHLLFVYISHYLFFLMNLNHIFLTLGGPQHIFKGNKKHYLN